jgi:hypothetical protein
MDPAAPLWAHALWTRTTVFAVPIVVDTEVVKLEVVAMDVDVDGLVVTVVVIVEVVMISLKIAVSEMLFVPLPDANFTVGLRLDPVYDPEPVPIHPTNE